VDKLLIHNNEIKWLRPSAFIFGWVVLRYFWKLSDYQVSKVELTKVQVF